MYSKHLVSTYYVSGTGLSANNTLVNKSQMVSTLKQIRIHFHSLPVLLLGNMKLLAFIQL